MRKILCVLFAFMLCIGAVVMSEFMIDSKNNKDDISFLSLQIKANSENDVGSFVTNEIKSAFENVLTPYIENEYENKDILDVAKSFSITFEQITKDILLRHELHYNAKIDLKLDEKVSGQPNKKGAVMVCAIGDGKGKDWWGLIYKKDEMTINEKEETKVYKFKIMDIIEKFFN